MYSAKGLLSFVYFLRRRLDQKIPMDFIVTASSTIYTPFPSCIIHSKTIKCLNRTFYPMFITWHCFSVTELFQYITFLCNVLVTNISQVLTYVLDPHVAFRRDTDTIHRGNTKISCISPRLTFILQFSVLVGITFCSSRWIFLLIRLADLHRLPNLSSK